ncbi:MAG: hypothetical protein ACJ77V_12860 [Chloroflexota bacterium]|jgi:hypothetical protein
MTAQTKHTDDTPEPRSGIGGTVADAAGTIRSAASDAAERIPEVASATRSALVEVDRQVEAGSDEMLTVGTALSFGLAAGMLLAGANRIMVLSAFIPAAVLGLRLLDRSSRSRTGILGTAARRRMQGA